MRKSSWVVSATLASCLLLPAAASADGLFFGAKTGPMLLKDAVTSTSNIDSHPTNVGVLVGYDMGLVVGDIGVEGEYTTTVNKGKDILGNDVSADTKAVYASFRTAGPFYFKVKGGYIDREVKVGSTTTKKTGSSYGAGLGFGIGIAQLELELTQMEKDAAFVSIGVQF